MKQRFSSLDVKVICHELEHSLVTLRLANIYDLSSRIFLFKFAKPDHREQLLIDSGFRCHLTSFARATAEAPSPFVARLRKFLRTRRVTKVAQVGTDRVIDIQFSDGQYHLYLEFYAGGNIILTDTDLTIIALLRTVNEGGEHEQYGLGRKYDLSLRQNYGGVPPLNRDRVREGLQKAIERQKEEAQKPGKKMKKKSGDALRKALAVTTTEFPPILIDHSLHVMGFDREAQPEDVVTSEELLDKLLASLQEAHNVVREITSAETAKGYILAKSSAKSAEQSERDDNQFNLVYEDFHPFKPAHLAADPSIQFIEHEGFNKTCDIFFSSLEGQKLESRLQEREETARRKIEQARQEQARRLDGLQQVQELNIRKAQAIEANVERVEEAVAAVNGLIAQGMDWMDIGRLIENEQKRHNAVAETVKLPLKLYENTVTLLLSEYADFEDEGVADLTESEESEDEEQHGQQNRTHKQEDRRLAVDIDLALSAWSNARQYYDQKRTAAEKQERTAQASQRALKSTEQKVFADLKKGLKQEKDILRPVRKQMWFEKFIYFISSDHYLVLAGRDAQQNDILYRRYLKKGDVYIHADLPGAASVIVKNNPKTPDAPIPPSTLGQAGTLAVCTSSAWDSKAVMSAWWVSSEQVSKTAPTGEYLAAGAFVIRGKKNYLPPAQLLLGFAILFRISEESKARHLKHRVQDSSDQTQQDRKEDVGAKADKNSADDDDDDFPDANDASSHNEKDTRQSFGHALAVEDADDDDDDFPDTQTGIAEPVDESEESEEDSDGADNEDTGAVKSNPLQPNRQSEHEPHHHHVAMSTNAVDLALLGHEHDYREDEDDDDQEGDEEEEGQDQSQNASNDGTSVSAPVSASGSAPNAHFNEKARTGAPPKQKSTPQVRGKRGKIKKLKQRYADQDEEDREAALRFLGSRAAADKREAEAAAKGTNTETAEEARARRRAQHERAQREGLQAEEMRRLHLEEGVEEPDEEEMEQLTQLDGLVGIPLPGDEILEAIPVCAPWTALGKYKFKVKMQPGQQKKGKAIREILSKWVRDAGDTKKIDAQAQDTERIWPRESELIKGLKEAEIVGVVPVKQVRVMMSGGAAGGEKGKAAARGGKGGGRGKGSKRAR